MGYCSRRIGGTQGVTFQINPSSRLPAGCFEKVAFCRATTHNSNERLLAEQLFTNLANLDSILKKIECPLLIGERKVNKNITIF